eukprot:TRINITY_DN4610_c0_g2_i4.p1 TRINITY_DN4610_c0_g2~~TRINITY_DN4610_c0_g2_i4.p1  ORF type:complete len:799 (-),score=111.02 TRINITY_DN4610_c0_g2_i4:1388-3784(-)
MNKNHLQIASLEGSSLKRHSFVSPKDHSPISSSSQSPLYSKKVRRSQSQELLNSWEHADIEELKAKFLDDIKKEKEATIEKNEGSIYYYKEYANSSKNTKSASDVRSFLKQQWEDQHIGFQSFESIPLFYQKQGRGDESQEEDDQSEEDSKEIDTLIQSSFQPSETLLIGLDSSSRPKVIAGTPDDLFYCLTSKEFAGVQATSNGSFIVSIYVKQFLSTFRYYAKANEEGSSPSHIVMQRLAYVFSENCTHNPTPEQSSRERGLQMRIAIILKCWIEYHFFDFESDLQLSSMFINFLKRIIEESMKSQFVPLKNASKKLCGCLTERLRDGLKRNRDRELTIMALRELSTFNEEMIIPLLTLLLPRRSKKNNLQGNALVDWIAIQTNLDKERCSYIAVEMLSSGVIEQAFQKFIDRGLNIKDVLSFMELKAMDIAKQMALMDFELIRKITSAELSFQSWNKADSKRRSPNITRFIERSNQISYWVATEIISCPDLRKRVSIVKRFIQIAEYCRKMNNFCSSINIVAGLNLGCVQRMKRTWEGIPEKYLSDLSRLTDLMSSIGNFKSYRASIKQITFPAVPYIAVTLKDLTFIEDGNPDFREDGLVNFEKMAMLSNAFEGIQVFQIYEYQFEENEEIRSILTKPVVIYDTDLLYKLAQANETGQSNSHQLLKDSQTWTNRNTEHKLNTTKSSPFNIEVDLPQPRRLQGVSSQNRVSTKDTQKLEKTLARSRTEMDNSSTKKMLSEKAEEKKDDEVLDLMEFLEETKIRLENSNSSAHSSTFASPPSVPGRIFSLLRRSKK